MDKRDVFHCRLNEVVELSGYLNLAMACHCKNVSITANGSIVLVDVWSAPRQELLNELCCWGSTRVSFVLVKWHCVTWRSSAGTVLYKGCICLCQNGIHLTSFGLGPPSIPNLIEMYWDGTLERTRFFIGPLCRQLVHIYAAVGQSPEAGNGPRSVTRSWTWPEVSQ